MKRFTGGPWKFSTNQRTIEAGSLAIAEVYGSTHTTSVAREESRANGRLISAAPEMFDLLDDLASALRGADLVIHRGSRDSVGNVGQKVYPAANYVLRIENTLRRVLGLGEGGAA